MFIPTSSSAHPVFDAIPETNHECPWSRERIAEYQKRINRIAGVAPNGRPNVRLIWPADPDERISMHVVDGEKRARYRLYTEQYEARGTTPAGLEIVEHIDVDITVPRFVLEEYHDPADVAMRDGHANEGEYTHLFSVASHDETCCDGREATASGELCLGLYREPGERELEELQRRIRAREAMKRFRRPGEAMSQEEIAESLRNLREWQENAAATRQEKYREAILDALAPMKHRLFSDDPSVHSNGKYHFVRGYQPDTEKKLIIGASE